MPAPLQRQPDDELIFHGDRVDFILRPVKTSHGGQRKREVVLHPGAVIVLPVLQDGRIVMIRNRRHTVNEVLLELCAGTLERDEAGVSEDPLACAGRELEEETGYRAGKVVPFGWFYTSPGILTEKMYAFVATDLTQVGQDLEDNEQIEVAI
ncbi:MAG TPA: NUDIX hydrolase, partial [Phycisphaerae bacterium]|nr:NUDIX hydrolase [Phycisphaerae bacterium]